MNAGKNRVRLALEQMEDRCTPSASGGAVAAHFSAFHGGSHAAAHVRSAHEHTIPIKVIEQCSADVSTGNASATGFATHVGRFTGEGRVESFHVEGGQATISGTLTIVTAKGDKLFLRFSSSWQLSTGKGAETIEVIGGTGRYAGASGEGTLDCTSSTANAKDREP